MTTQDLSEYTGKKVIVTRNLAEPNEKGETAIEIEGKVESANALGILIKPKGRTNLELIPVDEIEEVNYAPETAKPLKAKMLKEVEHGNTRTHLLERHGITLKEANGLDETSALEYHRTVDHAADDLGHVHGDKEETERAAAVDAAEAAEPAA